MEALTVDSVASVLPAATPRDRDPMGSIESAPGAQPATSVGVVPLSEAGERSAPTGSFEVRALRVGDLPALRHFDIVFRLAQPEDQLLPYSPLRAGISAISSWPRPRRRLYVATRAGRVVGFAQFRPLQPDGRWLLVATGAVSGRVDVEHVAEGLVQYGVIAAGRRGVKRLYARASAGSPISAALRTVGFTPFASEAVFVANQPSVLAVHVQAQPDLRRQEQSDTWAIHQLYNAAVPRQVQYAEAFTSHRWDVRAQRGRMSAVSVMGWLVEEGHHVVGYVRVASRRSTHVLEFVYLPERVDVLPTLIDGVLARLRPQPIHRVYAAVRGYQSEAATMLTQRGFTPVFEQGLHVKYTTANVRAPSFEVVRFHVDVRDKLPKRVPTFLQGQGHPRDESVS